MVKKKEKKEVRRFNKNEMAKYISDMTSLSIKESEWLTSRIYSKIREKIKEKGIYLQGIGSLDIVEVPERERMVFGELRKIPSKNKIIFKPNKKLVEEIE